MRFDYPPGALRPVRLPGKTLALRTGRGEKEVEILVAVLAHSCLICAEAVPDQRVRHWTMAHRRALESFGGVPERWIINNLKAGVDKPGREEPRLNPSFREFARHYSVAVLRARSDRPPTRGSWRPASARSSRASCWRYATRLSSRRMASPAHPGHGMMTTHRRRPLPGPGGDRRTGWRGLRRGDGARASR